MDVLLDGWFGGAPHVCLDKFGFRMASAQSFIIVMDMISNWLLMGTRNINAFIL